MGAVEAGIGGLGAAIGGVAGVVGDDVGSVGFGLARGGNGNVALEVQKRLPGVGDQPVIEFAGGGVGAFVGGDTAVITVDVWVFPAADGVRAGQDAVHRQDFQTLGHLHVGGVVVDGVADGVGGVVVAADGIDEARHFRGNHGGGGIHHGDILHHQLFHHHLGAGGGVALEGRNGQILAAHLLPVGDFTGVDALKLFGGQGIHGVIRVDHEHQRLLGDGLHQIGEGGVGHFVENLGLGLRGDDDVAQAFPEVAEGLGGAVEVYEAGDFLPALAQQHAGNALTQGHQGGGAVQNGKILPGEPEGLVGVDTGEVRRAQNQHGGQEQGKNSFHGKASFFSQSGK